MKKQSQKTIESHASSVAYTANQKMRNTWVYFSGGMPHSFPATTKAGNSAFLAYARKSGGEMRRFLVSAKSGCSLRKAMKNVSSGKEFRDSKRESQKYPFQGKRYFRQLKIA